MWIRFFLGGGDSVEHVTLPCQEIPRNLVKFIGCIYLPSGSLHRCGKSPFWIRKPSIHVPCSILIFYYRRVLANYKATSWIWAPSLMDDALSSVSSNLCIGRSCFWWLYIICIMIYYIILYYIYYMLLYYIILYVIILYYIICYYIILYVIILYYSIVYYSIL